jgi:opacity protein-like surface antigen
MGGLGGGEIGYNYQTANNWVFGVEADAGATNLHGSRTCDPGIDFATSLVCQNSSNWIATVAGRAGYSWGRTLYYVKAGGAWADDRVSTSCIFGPIGFCFNQFGTPTNGFNNSGSRSGWLIGYGTEFDLGKNWSAKAEYDYIDLGSRTALANDGVTTLRDSGVINQVKIGVNYRSGGAGREVLIAAPIRLSIIHGGRPSPAAARLLLAGVNCASDHLDKHGQGV